MNIKTGKRLSVWLLALSLVACQQRVWQPEASSDQRNLPVDNSLPVNTLAETTIAPYRAQVTSKMSEVIGTSPTELNKQDYESPLGNFVVDLMLEQAKKLYSGQLDMATTTNGGLRVPLPAGEVKVGNVFELMPFENELLVLTLSGQTVQELFDFAAATKIAPIANASYTAQGGKATDIKIGGKPLNPQQTYTMVTSDYLANGGDNMAVLKKSIKSERLGVMMREAILQQIRDLTAKGQPVTADTRPRVTVIP